MVSKASGFLIDFESAVPFTVRNSMLMKQAIKMAVKLEYIPIEVCLLFVHESRRKKRHTWQFWVARAIDYVNVPTMDTWAFGVAIFIVCFNAFPFAFDRTPDGKRRINREQLDLFVEEGFIAFLSKFHPNVMARYKRAEGDTKQFYQHVLGLLRGIFKRSKRDAMDVPTKNGKTRVYIFRTGSRFTMREVVDHSLWKAIGCRLSCKCRQCFCS